VTAQETNTSWHTAVIEWMPTVMSFYLDGKLLMASTELANADVANTRQHCFDFPVGTS
jgi:hypothetical protein